MADELKHVLSFYKDEKQKAKLDILQTPDIFIDMRSTVKEVQQWLKAKQFSGRYSLLLYHLLSVIFYLSHLISQ